MPRSPRRTPQHFKPSPWFWIATTSAAIIVWIALHIVLVQFAPHWGLRQNYKGMTIRDYVCSVVAGLAFVAIAWLWVRTVTRGDS